MITVTIHDDDMVAQEVSTSVSNPKKIYFSVGKLIVQWLKERKKTMTDIYDEPEWTPEEQRRSWAEYNMRRAIRKMKAMKEVC